MEDALMPRCKKKKIKVTKVSTFFEKMENFGHFCYLQERTDMLIFWAEKRKDRR